jgi:hypothetical protein
MVWVVGRVPAACMREAWAGSRRGVAVAYKVAPTTSAKAMAAPMKRAVDEPGFGKVAVSRMVMLS